MIPSCTYVSTECILVCVHVHLHTLCLSPLSNTSTASLVDHEEDWDGEDELATACDSSQTCGCFSLNSPPQIKIIYS